MLGNLRSTVAPLKRALAMPLARSGVSPDLVTLAAIPLSLGAAWLIVQGRPGLALLLAVPALLMDFLDGEVARLQGRCTPLGNLLEAVVDRVVEGALLVGLAATHPLAASAALGLSVLVSYVKARAGLVVVTDNRDWPGWGDHSDRAVLIALAILLEAVSGPSPAEAVLWLLASLAMVASLQRLAFARRLVSEGPLLPYLAHDEAGPGTSEAGR